MVEGKMRKHRHRAQVTGATYNPETRTSRVFRRCRCGVTDEGEVWGNWWVKPLWERAREKREGSVCDA